MAGDWIQMDDDLPEKPQVQQIVDGTGEEVETVLGRLFLLWRWADRYAIAVTDESRNGVTGALRGVRVATLCRLCDGGEKFWEAVAAAGWLTIEADNLVIPKYEKRFSKSAKQRALNALRQATYKSRQKKNGQEITVESRTSVTSPLPKEEKRRIDESKKERESPTATLPAGPARLGLSAALKKIETEWNTVEELPSI